MEIMEEPPPAAGGDDDREVELPADVLAEILRCLPPCSLAASRCVCTDWRSAIDSRRLLRADLLPPSLAGIFIDFNSLRFPEFFSHPSSSPTIIMGMLDFLPPEEQGPDIRDHCNGLLLLFSLLWVSMSDGTYQVIKHPKIYKSKQPPYIYIGKSEKGVYLASLHMLDCCLSIWILNESCGQFKWVLKHQNNLKPMLLRLNNSKQDHGPWTLQDVNYHLYSQKFPGEWELYNGSYDPSHFHSPNDDAPAENNFEWYSDDDNIVENQGNCEEHDNGDYLKLLGFHPYKEVIFLNSISRKGLAYHLNSSKLQHLGNLYPKHYNHFAQHEYISQAFPYTPCWVDELPEASTSLDSLHQD
uniref:F-box domain-containing protein n=1 Tax=Oryza meridionalis TaxID=40149 RepID=A0A0E0EKT0_9ORYZ